eukprot:gene14076-9252_t
MPPLLALLASAALPPPAAPPAAVGADGGDRPVAPIEGFFTQTLTDEAMGNAAWWRELMADLGPWPCPRCRAH